MVFTRSQIENLSREELIEELVKLSDITDRLKDLTDKFDNFSKKYEELKSDLVVTKKCNSLLYSRIVQLEKNAVSNAQYHRRETLELNPVSQDIHDNVLEDTICKALSLTGQEVVPEDLHACHRMSNRDRVIVKFKDRKLKHNVQIKRKNLHQKSLELSRLKFSGKLFVSESMCFENHQLAYKCRKLKNLGKIHSTWFYNNAVNIKLTENGRIHKIFHIIDIEKLLDIDNLDELLNR